ncbi:MAG: hypothetical protein JW787_06070 [Sedimentisphaerales bacterium]|nr:hypothetical protein [Sedimentisphaerales bacterium]
MTIEFNCPKCNSVIGFADKHAGKRAHCTSCGQSFFIPDKSYGKAQAIKPPKEVMSDPIPGFYRAVLIDNWKIFFNPKNITGIIFIMIAAVFHFFTANLNFVMTMPGRAGPFDIPVPFGYTCRGITWGFLFWYYSEIIYSTGFDEENFPEIIFGGFYSFIWKIILSVYTLIMIFIVVGLPALIIYFIFQKTVSENHVLSYLLIMFGLFLLPAAVMNAAAGRDLTLLRPDYLIKQAARDFIPYCVIYLLLSAAILLQMFARQYNPNEPSAIAIDLAINLAVQLVFIFAIHAAGLFYRHFSCHAPW